jgi:hypothetical protein
MLLMWILMMIFMVLMMLMQSMKFVKDLIVTPPMTRAVTDPEILLDGGKISYDKNLYKEYIINWRTIK